MKKLLMMAVMACAALLVSCVQVDKKAEQYAEQMFNAEWSQKAAVQGEIDKYVESLDAEEQVLFETAYKAKLKVLIKDKLYKGVEEIGDVISAGAEEAALGAEVVVDEIVSGVKELTSEDNMQKAADAMEEGAEKAADALEAGAEKAAEALGNIFN